MFINFNDCISVLDDGGEFFDTGVTAYFSFYSKYNNKSYELVANNNVNSEYSQDEYGNIYIKLDFSEFMTSRTAWGNR